MKLSPTFAAAWCLILGAAPVFGRQPAPQQEHLPPPQYLDGEAEFDLTTDENIWSPPPMPPLPYGFTWDHYRGAEYEHDIYGYRRLHPPPKKTVSCHGWLVGLTDSMVVALSYPTPNRPPPEYCPKGNGRIPGKISYNLHRNCGGSCACQTSQAAPVTHEPAIYAPHPLPQSEPPVNVLQQRVAPARPLVPPVLIDDSGLPAAPLVQVEVPEPAAVAPMSPPPVLTQDPLELPQNTVPVPGAELPRNRVPVRSGAR